MKSFKMDIMCNLETLWYYYPDLRFTQLIDFVKGEMESDCGQFFYVTDENTLEYIKKLVDKASKKE